VSFWIVLLGVLCWIFVIMPHSSSRKDLAMDMEATRLNFVCESLDGKSTPWNLVPSP